LLSRAQALSPEKDISMRRTAFAVVVIALSTLAPREAFAQG
jgi:hypothetical protein